jgi:hypothetical protein
MGNRRLLIPLVCPSCKARLSAAIEVGTVPEPHPWSCPLCATAHRNYFVGRLRDVMVRETAVEDTSVAS